MPIKLHYIAKPGRAEVSRLCLTLGGIPFENVVYTHDTWPLYKPKTPFGQVPVLELEDGRVLAQSNAINNYTAKLAGLFPKDSYAAALGDQVVALLDEFRDAYFAVVLKAKPEDVLRTAQEALQSEAIRSKLQHLSTLVDKPGFVAGDELSVADLRVFNVLSSLKPLAYDGVFLNALDPYPALTAYRNKVARVPGIYKHYEHETELPRSAYRPDN